MNKISLRYGHNSNSNILLENKAIVLSWQECNYARMGNFTSLYTTPWPHFHSCIRPSAAYWVFSLAPKALYHFSVLGVRCAEVQIEK